jgi:hypothetical protein
MPGGKVLLEETLSPVLTQVFDEQPIGPTGTYTNSSEVVVPQSHNDIALLVDLRVSGTPTDIRLDLQFSIDGGSHWFDPGIAFWQDLIYTPAAVGERLREWLVGVGHVAGGMARIAAIPSGSDGDNYWIANLWIRTT